MITIINATNLIGDSIYTLQPIKEYLEANPKEQIRLVADRGLAFQMFQDTFDGKAHWDHVPVWDDIDRCIAGQAPGEDIKILRLQAGEAGHWCFTQAQATGKQPHISDGFAHLLGGKLKEPVLPYAPWNNWEPHATVPPVRIGIAPFSRSCSRHSGELPNKTLDDWKWMHLITYFRLHCDELVVFGGPKDILQGVPISEDERFVASSFKELREKMKSLTCFITVDNGLGHLSSVLGVETVILWPKVSSVEFIAPLWAPKTWLMTNMDPNIATPAILLAGLRKHLREVINNATKA